METKEKKAPAKAEVKKNTWEYKTRTYYLTGNKEPLILKLSSRHTNRHPLLWFDEEKGYERELRYATNQKSIFVDEQNGPVTLEHIIFENGVLTVPKEKASLQRLLSMYHPAKDRIYKEHDKVEDAKDELSWIEFQIQALNAAQSIDVDHAEAILRVEIGSEVSKMSSKEIKRDLLMFAKKSPQTFMALLEDGNVELRNHAIKASEAGVIALSPDQRTFTWASNGKKLMTVPFDENPFSAMAAWFKTDEGLAVYKSIEKKFK
jgi:hypothetical protein